MDGQIRSDTFHRILFEACILSLLKRSVSSPYVIQKVLF